MGSPDPAVSTGYDLWISIAFAIGHQCPHRSGGLVGERDSRNLRWTAAHQLHEPGPTCTVTLGVADHRHGADHQHLAQIAIAGFGDAAKALLSAARVLPRYKSDPGREVTPRFEDRWIRDAGNESAG
jgi:hypothetical protein